MDQDLINKAFIIKKTNENPQIHQEERTNGDDIISEFAMHNPILGTIHNENMEIELEHNTPFQRLPYTIPYGLKDNVNEEVKRFLDLGIIRKSNSKYASPAFAILERNGKIRLVEDYRELNKITKKDATPLPNLWDKLRSIPKSSYFGQIDLSMGYHQVKLYPESCGLTAFVLPNGHYEYTRVPFGLTNAPRVFTRIMRKLFAEIPFVRIFLDYILVFSATREEHRDHLQTILSIIRDNSISISFEESTFFASTVSYIGHIINDKGCIPDLSRLKDVSKIESPTSIKKVQKLCGYINWFRPFIPNLSTRLKTITDIINKDVKFSWCRKDDEIIKEIFSDIKNTTRIHYAYFNQAFTLEVDASDYEAGAALYQN